MGAASSSCASESGEAGRVSIEIAASAEEIAISSPRAVVLEPQHVEAGAAAEAHGRSALSCTTTLIGTRRLFLSLVLAHSTVENTPRHQRRARFD